MVFLSFIVVETLQKLISSKPYALGKNVEVCGKEAYLGNGKV